MSIEEICAVRVHLVGKIKCCTKSNGFPCTRTANRYITSLFVILNLSSIIDSTHSYVPNIQFQSCGFMIDVNTIFLENFRSSLRVFSGIFFFIKRCWYIHLAFPFENSVTWSPKPSMGIKQTWNLVMEF